MFKRLFGEGKVQSASAKPEEAVLIHLDSLNLDDGTYANDGLYTLEDLLIERLGKTGAGELDGHETGPSETTIFCTVRMHKGY